MVTQPHKQRWLQKRQWPNQLTQIQCQPQTLLPRIKQTHPRKNYQPTLRRQTDQRDPQRKRGNFAVST